MTSTGTGTAIVTLVGGIISFRVDLGGNLQNVMAAHIHGPANATQTAGVRMDLYVPPAGTTASFTTTAPLAGGVGVVRAGGITQDSLIVLLRNGNSYANVHTSANPGGELRGQLIKQ